MSDDGNGTRNGTGLDKLFTGVNAGRTVLWLMLMAAGILATIFSGQWLLGLVGILLVLVWFFLPSIKRSLQLPRWL